MYSLYLDRDGMDSVLMGVFETPEKAEEYVLENEDNFEGWDWILTDDYVSAIYVSGWEPI
jgi:hypothetical protein